MKADSFVPTLVAATEWEAASGGVMQQQPAAGMITAVICASAEVERSVEDKNLDPVEHGKHAMMAHGSPKAGCCDFDIDSKGVSNVSAQDKYTGKSSQGEHAMTKNGHLSDKFQMGVIPAAPQGGPQSEVSSYMDASCVLKVCAHDKITGTSLLPLDGTFVPMHASDMDANGILTISEQEKPTQQLQKQQQQHHGDFQLLMDGTPASMGFETASDGMTEPFEKNMTIHAINAQTSAMSAANQPEVLTQACANEHATTKDGNRSGTFLDGTAPAPQSRPQSKLTPGIDTKGILSISVQDKPTGKSFEHEKAATKNKHLARYLECIRAKKTLVPVGTVDMDAKGIFNVSVQEGPTCRRKVMSNRNANGIFNVSKQEKPTDASLLLLDAMLPSMGMYAAGGVTTNSFERRRVEEMHDTLASIKAFVSQYTAPRQAARMRKLEQQLAALESGNKAP